MLHPHIVVYESAIHGRGLKAIAEISAEEIVWELGDQYTVYTRDEVSKFPDDERTLVYCEEGQYILMHDGSQYMNHSCDPNTWVDKETRTLMVARRTIHAGEEITYDYATSEIDPILRDPLICRCGSENCRGVIRHDDILLPEVQTIHEGRLPDAMLHYIEAHKPTLKPES